MTDTSVQVVAGDARPIPRATYRIQLHRDFTFIAAAGLAPYLEQLGISHAYLSPILKARPGSTHGYDTVDHTALNPELGTRADFEAMAAAFRRHGIGIVLDIVPNHMGVGGDLNAQWLDLLEWGRRSRFAEWFDINWTPTEPTLRNKVLVPFLGTTFGQAIEAGKLELRKDQTGKFAIWAEGSHKLPVCPDTYELIGVDPERLNTPGGRPELIRLIDAQHWRPARYSVAADDINYRRFFIVSDLAAIRIERDDVFDHVHRLVFELVEQGLVEGLRVDHIDGLYDPKAYCQKLRARCPRPIYLVVEKILAPHEQLRADWDVEGTTGYEFAAAATKLLVDPQAESALGSVYQNFTGRTGTLAEIERTSKRGIIDYEMAAELDGLATRLRSLAASGPATIDLTRNGLRAALREIVASMPVYRSYVDGDHLSDEDRRSIEFAVGRAREAAGALDPQLFSFVRATMLGETPDGVAAPRQSVLDLAQRIQQYTGPVMAKGLEDTALYRYNRLIALSDVGEKPDRVGESVEAFHAFSGARRARSPHGMLTSSSHDTKRGEDSRARIAAISGRVDTWRDAVEAWRTQLVNAGAPTIEPNDLYYFFQLLLGSWPADFPDQGALDPATLSAFRKRLDAAMLKSVREARQKTNWSVPASDYETATSSLVEIALRPAGKFLDSFRKFESELGRSGAMNGLIETVLKLTVPGVPDIYQGAEFWEQSMVDPDNRRAVDFEARKAALSAGSDIPALITNWRDGRLKQHVIRSLLDLRRRSPELFASGSYEPIYSNGRTSVLAFLRRLDQHAILVAISLYPWRESHWGPQDQLQLPSDMPDCQWRDVLSGHTRSAAPLRNLVGSLPIAMLYAS